MPSAEESQRLVGEQLRRARERLGWSLRDVAAKTAGAGRSLSAATLSRLERAETSVRLDEALVLCRVLGVSVGLLDEILQVATFRHDADLAGRSPDDLIEEGERCARGGRLDRALSALQSAREAAEREARGQGSVDRQAAAMISQGECLRRIGCLESSLGTVGQVLNLAGLSRDREAVAYMMHVILYRARGETYQEQLYLTQAERVLGPAPPKARAYGLAVLGAIKWEERRYEEAIAPLQASVELYRNTRLQWQFAHVCTVLGDCLARAGQQARGLQLLDQSMRVAQRLDLPAVLGRAIRLKGLLELDYHRHDSARRHFAAALQLARSNGQIGELLLAWLCMRGLEDRVSSASRVAQIDSILRRLLKRTGFGSPAARSVLTVLGTGLARPG